MTLATLLNNCPNDCLAEFATSEAQFYGDKLDYFDFYCEDCGYTAKISSDGEVEIVINPIREDYFGLNAEFDNESELDVDFKSYIG